MLLRRQFAALVGLAVAVGAGALGALLGSVVEARQLAYEQGTVRAVAREASQLVVLTQGYLLEASDDARQGWMDHRNRLERLLAQLRGSTAAPQPARLAQELATLPQPFDRLAAMPSPEHDTPETARQRQQLVAQVLGGARALWDHAYQLEGELTVRRGASELRLMALAVATPALLALLFAGTGLQLSRRVLHPLQALDRAMQALADGDAGSRCRSAATNEIGALGRRFDAMAEQLEQRSAALRASEAMLRLVTDNVPAMIGYWDVERRNRFANADYRRWFGKSPAEIHGCTMQELLGDELYAKNKPFVNAAFAGRRQDFDRAIPGPDGVLRYSQASYIPDVHAGSVQGIFVLVTDVTERVLGEQALHKAVLEKETLLREVYHRVKNNLQVVQSLLNLQGRAVSDDSARAALQETAQRVRAMALVHEQLYRTETLSAVALERYVANLARQLVASSTHAAGEIALELDVARTDIGMDSAVPLGLLLTELITNSLKHAFPAGQHGRIAVRIQPQGAQLCLRVADDGVGLPAALDPLTARSTGLQLAASLARQLGGELSFESSRGTAATLCFDVLNP